MKSLFCFCLLVVFTYSFAQDGNPDLSFGNDGVVIYELAGDDHWINGVDENSNGRILALIKTIDFQTNDLVRIFAFNPDGSIDTQYGNNGILEITTPNTNFNDLKILPNNSYFLVGFTNSVFTIYKYNEEGSLDTSFGDNGALQPYGNGVVGGSSMVINEDQTLFFLGNQIIQDIPHILFYKFLENGIPDTSFGDNGVVLYSLGNVTNAFAGIRKINDFFYVGIGYQENSVPTRNIYKFSLDGEIDATFGTNGRVIIPMEEQFSTIFNVLNDDNIIIGGSYYDSNTDSMVRKTIKINSQGQINQNFGNGGVINGLSGGYIQGNQRFILDGTFFDFEGGASPFYARYFPNGTQDNTFQFFSNYVELGSFTVKHLQNGKMLILGSDIWYNGPEINIILQRFNNSPLSVSDIDINNIAVYPNPSSGVFQLQHNLPFSNNTYDIYDSFGKKVKTGILSENIPSIDISEFSSGVYFLKIFDIPKTFKLLKQ